MSNDAGGVAEGVGVGVGVLVVVGVGVFVVVGVGVTVLVGVGVTVLLGVGVGVLVLVGVGDGEGDGPEVTWTALAIIENLGLIFDASYTHGFILSRISLCFSSVDKSGTSLNPTFL